MGRFAQLGNDLHSGQRGIDFVENMFDEAYFPSAHGDNNIQPGEPFSARVGVRFSF